MMFGRYRSVCTLGAGLIKLPPSDKNESKTSPSLLRQMALIEAALIDRSRESPPTGYFRQVNSTTHGGHLGAMVYSLAGRKAFQETGFASYQTRSVQSSLRRIAPGEISLLKETAGSVNYVKVVERKDWVELLTQELIDKEDAFDVYPSCPKAMDPQLIEYADEVIAISKRVSNY